MLGIVRIVEPGLGAKPFGTLSGMSAVFPENHAAARRTTIGRAGAAGRRSLRRQALRRSARRCQRSFRRHMCRGGASPAARAAIPGRRRACLVGAHPAAPRRGTAAPFPSSGQTNWGSISCTWPPIPATIGRARGHARWTTPTRRDWPFAAPTHCLSGARLAVSGEGFASVIVASERPRPGFPRQRRNRPRQSAGQDLRPD